MPMEYNKKMTVFSLSDAQAISVSTNRIAHPLQHASSACPGSTVCSSSGQVLVGSHGLICPHSTPASIHHCLGIDSSLLEDTCMEGTPDMVCFLIRS